MKQHYIEKNGRQIYVEEHFPEGIDHPVPTVIFSHGFNSSYGEFQWHCKSMVEHGFGAVCYDFCGGSVHSKSSGETRNMTLLTEKEDLQAVFEYTSALEYVDASRLYLFGASQGGMVSALFAEDAKEMVAGLMLLFPAFCIPDDWQKKVPAGEEAPEEFNLWGVTLGKCYYETVKDWDIFKKVGTFPKRTRIWHGVQDAVVSVDYARKMKDIYPDATYREFPEEGHGFSEKGNKEVIQDVLEFIKTDK